MRIIGCDLHSRQQTLAMLDTETGEVKECVLRHQGDAVRKFYAGLPGPVRVGIEATGSMQWFLELMEELKVECLVGHPAKIRAYEPRKQKNDRRDAQLLLELLEDERFPTIWMPSVEQRDVRALLRHRHLWVRMRVRIQNGLQALALSHAIRRGAGLWSEEGQHSLLELKLPPFMEDRRNELRTLYRQLQADIEVLDKRVAETAENRPLARMLMTHPGVGPNTALATEVFLGDAQRFADGSAAGPAVTPRASAWISCLRVNFPASKSCSSPPMICSIDPSSGPTSPLTNAANHTPRYAAWRLQPQRQNGPACRRVVGNWDVRVLVD